MAKSWRLMSIKELQNILRKAATYTELSAFKKNGSFWLLFNLEDMNFVWGGIRTCDPAHALHPLDQIFLIKLFKKFWKWSCILMCCSVTSYDHQQSVNSFEKLEIYYHTFLVSQWTDFNKIFKKILVSILSIRIYINHSIASWFIWIFLKIKVWQPRQHAFEMYLGLFLHVNLTLNMNETVVRVLHRCWFHDVFDFQFFATFRADYKMIWCFDFKLYKFHL